MTSTIRFTAAIVPPKEAAMTRLFVLFLPCLLLFIPVMLASADAQSSTEDDLCAVEQIWLGDLEVDLDAQFTCHLACEVQAEGYTGADLCQTLADYDGDDLAELCTPCDTVTETEGDAQ